MDDPLLRVRQVGKSFGALVALSDLSFDVARGEIHALIGPNGAGKTTAVNQIAGEQHPDSGTIELAGRDVTRLPVHARARLGLARSFQITSLFEGMTALDNVALAVQAHQGHGFGFWAPATEQPALREPAARLLERLGLAGSAEIPAARLAHGEKRRLELAMALAGKPALLLLDEPMAGAGPEATAELTGLLRDLRGEVTMLLVEHDMDVVFSLADRVSVLVGGALIATGAPDAVRADAAVRRAYLGGAG